jgi:chloride channel 2
MAEVLEPRIERSKRESIFKINPNKPTRANLLLTDYFTNIDQVSKDSFTGSGSGMSKLKQFMISPHVLNPSILLALTILGLFSAVLGFIVDYAIQHLQLFRTYLISTNNLILDMGIWISYSVVLCLIAGFLGQWTPSVAEGSGIAETKATLSGIKIPKFFSYRTLFTKLISLILTIGGGLSIGKEGPFVHVAGIIANKISQITFFSHIHRNLTLRNQFLAASVAAGIASIFGSPIGAVLFSIEVTATYYIVSNMWRAAFCTIWCTIGYELLQSSKINDGILNTHFKTLEISSELFYFIILGAGAGVLGAVFIIVSRKLVELRFNNTYPLLHGKFRYILLVSVICSVATFATPYLEQTDRTVINNMFQTQDASENGWSDTNFGMNLLVYMSIKYFITVICVSVQLPAGVIFPLLTCGAVYGRLVGYIVEQTAGTMYSGIYAAVGAAALVSSATHSVSVAIIVFELTGEIHYLIPMMIGVFLAYGVSSAITVSYYDSMLEIKKLPYLPSLKSTELYSYTAKNLLETKFPCIQSNSSLRDLTNAILEGITTMNKIPVIDGNRVLVSEITIENGRKYLNAQYAACIAEISPAGRAQLQRFLDFFMNIHPDSFVEDYYESFLHEEDELEEVTNFMNTPIDVNFKILGTDDSPFSIAEATPLAKIHFLFIMLGLTQIYVTKKGELVGLITRECFVRKLNI